jgi:ABC-type multidrug transport system ATPase subunit
MMNPTVIEIENVKKSFNGNEVLRDVSITVNRGSIFALLGANGAGKSTLLKIVTGLLKSDGGKVAINDINVAQNPTAVQKLFSFSSQNTTVDGVLTGYENLVLIAKLRHAKGLGGNPYGRRIGSRFELFNCIIINFLWGSDIKMFMVFSQMLKILRFKNFVGEARI